MNGSAPHQDYQSPFSYPVLSRADKLKDNLKRTAAGLAHVGTDFDQAVQAISGRLSDVALMSVLPDHQLFGWLRIASVFRLSAPNDQTRAATAGAALEFLNENIETAELKQELRSDLNWVLDHTLHELGLSHEGGWVRDCLSESELAALNRHLTSDTACAEFNALATRAGVRNQLESLQAFSVLAKISNLDRKIEDLFTAAERDGEAALVARSALRYVALVEDVVPDSSGLLGLLDDLYAIEWAYAVVEEHTLGLPRLAEMLKRWPYLSSSYVMSGGRLMDRFTQYALGSANLMMENNGGGTLVLRDAATFSIPVAASTALQIACDEVGLRESQEWPTGTMLTLSDGVRPTLRVRFAGRVRIGARRKVRLEVARSGYVHIDEDLECYLHIAPREYLRLSSGNDVSVWVRDLRVDPLSFLCGGIQRAGSRTAVLLVAPRSLVDLYLPELYCRGQPFSALLGATWVKSSGEEELLASSVSDRPAIYACAAPETAFDLILEPPDNVISWKVIVHGGGAAARLRAALRSAGVLDIPLVALADLSERSEADTLDVCLAEDLDVLPCSDRMRGFSAPDLLTRALARQTNHWVANTRVHLVSVPELEALEKAVASMQIETDSDPLLVSLNAMLRHFLMDAGRLPIAASHSNAQLYIRAGALAHHAGMLAQYDDCAAVISALMEKVASDGLSYPDLLPAILDRGRSDPVMGNIAVLAGSQAEAESNLSILREHGSEAVSITAQDAFLYAPFERLIVPGWYRADNASTDDISTGNSDGHTFASLPAKLA